MKKYSLDKSKVDLKELVVLDLGGDEEYHLTLGDIRRALRQNGYDVVPMILIENTQ